MSFWTASWLIFHFRFESTPSVHRAVVHDFSEDLGDVFATRCGGVAGKGSAIEALFAVGWRWPVQRTARAKFSEVAVDLGFSGDHSMELREKAEGGARFV